MKQLEASQRLWNRIPSLVPQTFVANYRQLFPIKVRLLLPIMPEEAKHFLSFRIETNIPLNQDPKAELAQMINASPFSLIHSRCEQCFV
ncbi:hypothetical protein [Methylocystis bryophila]|nr:hypothetical protein [Methylocystis bryophila]